MTHLEIIYENADLIAINKPHGLLVHRTRIAKDATKFALQMLRDQIGQRVHPIHRLDRKTSGVLLFAKNEESLSLVSKMFQESQVEKKYEALVRGFINDKASIDYDLNNEGKVQTAKTDYLRLKKFEIPLPFGKHQTSRYSLVELTPLTGRFHQLRKHMAHLRHPILGDRPHGCNKQNKLWKETYNMTTMMLHAKHLSFKFKDEHISIKANRSKEMTEVLTFLESNSSCI